MREGRRRLFVQLGGQCVDCGVRGATRATIAGPYQPDIRTHRYYRFKLSAGCEGCGGSGVNSKEITNLAWFSSRILTPKQFFILGLRYGFKDGNIYSQWEVAKLMDISQSTVSRMEKRAVERVTNRAAAILGSRDENLWV